MAGIGEEGAPTAHAILLVEDEPLQREALAIRAALLRAEAATPLPPFPLGSTTGTLASSAARSTRHRHEARPDAKEARSFPRPAHRRPLS